MNIVNKRLLTMLLGSSLWSLSSYGADENSPPSDPTPEPTITASSTAVDQSEPDQSEPEQPQAEPIQAEPIKEASTGAPETSAVNSEADNEQAITEVRDDTAKESLASPAAEASPASTKTIEKPLPVDSIQDAKAQQSDLIALIKLVEENKFTLAYRMGLTLQEFWEGDEKFDFNFALAAAQTAHYNQAVFPFQRLLEAHPNNLRFRLELARCHFFLNNLNAAEREFKQVAASRPPKEVQGHINRFLNRIAEKKQQVTQSWNAGAGLMLGYDSNINAAADLDAIEATFYLNDSPALTGVLSLEDEQKSQASSYYQLQGFGQYQQPLSKRTSFDLSLTAAMKDNSIDDSYDLTNLAANGGFRLLRSNHNVRFGGTFRQYWLAGESLQNQLLANVRWQWYLSPLWKTNAEFEAGQQDNDQNDALDFSQWQGKFALNRNAGGLGQNFQLSFGSDIAKDKVNEFQGRNYYAFNYQAQQTLTSSQQMYALVNYRTNTYSAAFADDHIFFAGETRKDQLIQLIAGWSYQFMPNTAAKAQLSHSQNQSNLELYDYQRTLVEAGLTISFK
jgi:hypothetical protein